MKISSDSMLDDETQENMKSALREALISVRDGRLGVEDALENIIYLIYSIDNRESSEIQTWTKPDALITKST